VFVIKKYWQQLLVLSLGHGLNDFAAGYMLGTLVYQKATTGFIIAAFLFYNLLAFGGQYFVALLLQHYTNTKRMLCVAVLANFAAVSLFHFYPLFALLLAGCASALYHVAGSSACYKKDNATSVGIFAAPGIVGLALAGYLAYRHVDIWNYLLGACILFVFVLSCMRITQHIVAANKKLSVEVDNHDLLMILLLGVIALRSAVWNIIQIAHENDYAGLLAIALSAFVGKIAGGWISDKMGWKTYSLLSLITAMPLVTYFKDELILFCIGIGLLQSAIPANTVLLIQYYKGKKEEAFAFSFGLAVLAGLFITAGVQYISSFSSVYLLLGMLFLFSIGLFVFKFIIPSEGDGLLRQ
jgi:hypothetical protein